MSQLFADKKNCTTFSFAAPSLTLSNVITSKQGQVLCPVDTLNYKDRIFDFLHCKSAVAQPRLEFMLFYRFYTNIISSYKIQKSIRPIIKELPGRGWSKKYA
jgi:hypothetical protein